MDTSKAKGKATKKDSNFEATKVESLEVKSVRVVETKRGDLVFFTLVINGVFINNCKVATGKNGDFVGWPQYKGSDDKWYNVVYVPLSDDDTKKIMELVQEAINE